MRRKSSRRRTRSPLLKRSGSLSAPHAGRNTIPDTDVASSVVARFRIRRSSRHRRARRSRLAVARAALRHPRRGRVARLFLGTGISDYLDVLGDAALIMPELAESIASSGICSSSDRRHRFADSPAGRLVGECRRTGAVSDPFDQWRRTGVGESHLDALSKKDPLLPPRTRRMGDVVVEAPAPDTLDDLLTAFFDLHTARWKRPICGRPRRETAQGFHREVARRMLDHGCCGCTPRASPAHRRCLLRLRTSRHVYTTQRLRSRSGKLSIGTLIVAHAIEEAVRDARRRSISSAAPRSTNTRGGQRIG